MKKIYVPLAKSIKETWRGITRTMTETSIKNNKTISDSKVKFSEIMNDRRLLATSLLSPLSKITNPNNIIQFKLVTDTDSIRVKDL